MSAILKLQVPISPSGISLHTKKCKGLYWRRLHLFTATVLNVLVFLPSGDYVCKSLLSLKIQDSLVMQVQGKESLVL